MKKNLYTDGVIGIGLLIFSIVMYFFIIPSQIKNITFGSGGLAPSTFPKLAIVLIGIFSICLIISNFSFKIQTTIEKIGPKAPIIVFFLIGYLLLISIIGHLFATPIFLLLIMIYLSKDKWPRYILTVIIFILINYIFFEKILRIILPKGFLFN